MEQRRLASTEWVDIVNEENEVIAQASREQMRAQCLRHRATYIVVHDGMGKILVQRRTETKDFFTRHVRCDRRRCSPRPMSNCWNPRVAKRKKSWALPVSPLPSTGSSISKIKNCRVWGALFSCVSHGPFALQEDEVSEVCWLTPEEITARCDEFTPDSLKALALWMKRNAKNEAVETETAE
ncbi:NUDIX hydrolase YfcD [Escherichia coli]|nr:NUDIX hydrolase YfcD [Escherichia coli]